MHITFIYFRGSYACILKGKKRDPEQDGWAGVWQLFLRSGAAPKSRNARKTVMQWNPVPMAVPTATHAWPQAQHRGYPLGQGSPACSWRQLFWKQSDTNPKGSCFGDCYYFQQYNLCFLKEYYTFQGNKRLQEKQKKWCWVLRFTLLCSGKGVFHVLCSTLLK